MSKLSPVSWRELVTRLHKLGFEGPYQQGAKHAYVVKGQLVLAIPNPHRREVGVDLLTRILRRGRITREDWLESA